MRFRFPDKPIRTTPEFFASMSPLELSKWIIQRKYDGWRMLVFVDSPGTIRCVSRVNRPIEQAYRGTLPDHLYSDLECLNLPQNTILDTELIGPRGHLPHAVFVLDMLAWDNKWLTSQTFEERWMQCTKIVQPKTNDTIISLAETVFPSPSDAVNLAIRELETLQAYWREHNLGINYLYEGLVLKRRTGKLVLNLQDSAKSPQMYKLKFREGRDDRF